MIIINPYILNGVFVPGPFDITNPGGQGNRTAIITVGGTLSCNTGVSSALVNGDLNIGSPGSCTFSNSAGNPVGTTILFSFLDSKKEIDQMNWLHGSNVNQGIWDIHVGVEQVAPSTWTLVHSSFDMNAAGASLNTVTFTGPTAQGWHLRLTRTGGTCSTTPYEKEVTFRIRDVI